MMTPLTADFRHALADAESPCLSLYQPKHRHYPGNQQDPVRFGNLVKKLDQSLKKKYSPQEIHTLLESFEALSHDSDLYENSD